MAITRVQEDTGRSQGSGTCTVAFGSNVTSGNLIVVVCGRYGSSSTHTLTKSSGTATIGTPTKEQDFWNGQVEYGAVFSVPVTGSGSLTLSFNSPDDTGSYASICAVEYSGADVSSSRVAATTTPVTHGAATTSATGTAASGGGGVFIGVCSVSAGGVITLGPTSGNNFSQIDAELDGGSYTCYSAIERIVSSDTTDEADWTHTSLGGGSALVIYKEATSGSGPGQVWSTVEL